MTVGLFAVLPFFFGAVDVRQVMVEGRPSFGNANVGIQQPIDSASWGWMPGLTVPPVPARSARACGVPSGPPCIWEFAEAAPSGGRLEKLAAVREMGLACASVTNIAERSGFWLDDRISPEGAFLFEADMTLGNVAAEEKKGRKGVLFDTMGVAEGDMCAHKGFQVVLSQGPGGTWSPTVYLGMGTTTLAVRGPATKRFRPDEVAHFAFLFGANGRLVIEFGGEVLETRVDAVGPLAASVRPTVIGSRNIGNYWHLDGAVRRVSLTPLRTEPLAVLPRGPVSFVRGCEAAKMGLSVVNGTGGEMSGLAVSIEQFGEMGLVRRSERLLGAAAPGRPAVVEIPLETRIRPGWHPLRVISRARAKDGVERAYTNIVRYGIGPQAGDRMMTLMWGFNAPPAALSDLGFTHGLAYRPPNPDAADNTLTELLDESVMSGVGIARSVKVLYPKGKDVKTFYRQTRSGDCRQSRYFDVPEVSNPELRDLMRGVVAADAARYGDYPAFVGVLPCSEIRDAAFPSFNTEAARYKAETGRDVPVEVEQKKLVGAAAKAMQARYPDGAVPEDDPVLRYYDWYWTGGDGWPAYISTVADEYRRLIPRRDFFTFWDPAVRCPSHWGSGGSVDLINQWCYAVPEAMNVAGPCEEMFAMAAGRSGQDVSIMTQLICYRTQMAPKERKVSPEPEWIRRFPDAAFPTIPPDTLQEAVWSMLAKPVKAVMFHGWGTVYDTGERRQYCFTNPESRERLRFLLKEVVQPLGPTLKRLGREPSPVAVLESFTTAAFGGPASWGWKAPAVTFLQRARLDPRVLYEQTVLRDGLDGVKVLYAPQCRFLPAAVVARIREFQRRGGLLLADGECLAALKPDFVLPLVSFDPPPASDHTAEVDAMEASREGDAKTRAGTLRAKAKMLADAEDLRKTLAAKYRPAADSSSPEIVVYSRRWKSADYLFAVNDRRTFGDYVGPWGLVMEKGQPFAGEVSQRVGKEGVGAVYELSRGCEVPFRTDGVVVRVPLEFATNDGRLLLFLPSRIAEVSAEVPDAVVSGERLSVKMTVRDAAGRPVPALLPVDIRVCDAEGRELDGCGPGCAEGGVCQMEVQTNLDDAGGSYRVVCTDRASGLQVTKTVPCENANLFQKEQP